MTDFADKRGRTIKIDVDECAYAYHNGKCIGFVETTGPRDIDPRTTDLPPQIIGWEVDEPYRRAGICEEMVRLLYEQWGTMDPAEKNVGVGDVNALTADGMAITRRCQKLGYIAEFADERPPHDQDYE